MRIRQASPMSPAAPTLGGRHRGRAVPAHGGLRLRRQYTILTAGRRIGGGATIRRASPATDCRPAASDLAQPGRRPTPISNLAAQPSCRLRAPALTATSKTSPTPMTNSFNSTGGIPTVFSSLSPAALTQVSGETGNRLAADDVRRDEVVHGRDDRSLHCRRGAGDRLRAPNALCR